MENKKVMVFGSYITDLTARVSRFPDAGETVQGLEFWSGPGGKGSNQAVAAHRAGASVCMVTKVGKDIFGQRARAFYMDEGMAVNGIFEDESERTGAALIEVDEVSGQNKIVVVPGACYDFKKEDRIRARALLERGSIFLTQLETDYEAVREMLIYAKENDCLTILNPAPAQALDAGLLTAVDIITPNETEAKLLTGIEIDSSRESIRNAAGALIEKGVGRVIITLGAMGAYGTDGQTELFCPSIYLGKVVDTTGAGDAFNGGLAAALAQNRDFFDAIRFATAAGAVCVMRRGTAPAMPYVRDICRVMENTIQGGS